MTLVPVPGEPVADAIDADITRLRELDTEALRARWQSVFRRGAPVHLPRQLLFRILAWRLQADRCGDFDAATRRLLQRIAAKEKPDKNRLGNVLAQSNAALRPGTVLVREWDGHPQQVMVLPDGFAWNGNTYRSLSKVALAITGTRWSGPRFFGIGRPEASP